MIDQFMISDTNILSGQNSRNMCDSSDTMKKQWSVAWVPTTGIDSLSRASSACATTPEWTSAPPILHLLHGQYVAMGASGRMSTQNQD